MPLRAAPKLRRLVAQGLSSLLDCLQVLLEGFQRLRLGCAKLPRVLLRLEIVDLLLDPGGIALG